MELLLWRPWRNGPTDRRWNPEKLVGDDCGGEAWSGPDPDCPLAMSNPQGSGVAAKSPVRASGEYVPGNVSDPPPGPEGGEADGPGGPERVAGVATVLETSAVGSDGPGGADCQAEVPGTSGAAAAEVPGWPHQEKLRSGGAPGPEVMGPSR